MKRRGGGPRIVQNSSRVAAVVLSGLVFSACTPNLEAFAKLCREKARVVIQDRTLWNEYLSGLNADHREYGDRTRPGSPYLVLFGTSGFEQPNDFSLGKVKPRDRRAYPNNFYVIKDGKAVATIINYNLSWNGPDSGQTVTCIHNHPEVYGVRVAEADTERDS